MLTKNTLFIIVHSVDYLTFGIDWGLLNAAAMKKRRLPCWFRFPARRYTHDIPTLFGIMLVYPLEPKGIPPVFQFWAEKVNPSRPEHTRPTRYSERSCEIKSNSIVSAIVSKSLGSLGKSGVLGPC